MQTMCRQAVTRYRPRVIRKVCNTIEDARDAVAEMAAHGRAGGLLLSADNIEDRTIGFCCSGGSKRWVFPLTKIRQRTFRPVFKEWLNTTEGRAAIAGTANKAAGGWFKKEGKARPESCLLCAVAEVMES